MKAQDLELLRELPMLRPLSEEQLARFIRGAYLQRFPKGTVLFEEGDDADFLHVLLEGSVELYATAGASRSTVVDIVWPVDSFILAAALTATPSLMSARTIQPCRILMIRSANLRQEIAADPQLALIMMASLAQHFRTMVRQVKDLKLRNSTQRLGCFLLRLVSETGRDGEADLPFGKRLLASRLGMTAENLSRAFGSLRQHGLEVAGNRVIVTNMAKLEAYCQPDRLIDEVDRNLTIRPIAADEAGEEHEGRTS